MPNTYLVGIGEKWIGLARSGHKLIWVVSFGLFFIRATFCPTQLDPIQASQNEPNTKHIK